jgi:two-component system chemotaxis response regulator CheB
MIRVLVAEDSPTARALLVAMLESDPDIRVVGQAHTGSEAVEMAARLEPDLITMDVEMPEMDGLTATQRIMMRTPTPIIIISAQAKGRVAELGLDATRAGALLVLPKPSGPDAPDFAAQRSQLVAMAKAMAQVKVVRRWSPGLERQPRPMQTVARAPGTEPARLVAVGASTGGPAALHDILAALPASFAAPILVVQHIARGFVSALAHWLGTDSPLRVRVASDGEAARPGVVYLAPDDRHLGVRADPAGSLHIALSRAEPLGGFRPSADWLFQSAAAAAGHGVLAVILTGMGDDGVEGLRAVRAAGGRVIAQDESTSVIYGMPREAVRAGVVHDVVALDDLPERMVEAVA